MADRAEHSAALNITLSRCLGEADNVLLSLFFLLFQVCHFHFPFLGGVVKDVSCFCLLKN